LGRAIRKIKSKLRSGADLFYFSEIEFIQGKTYKTLTDAILIDKFKNLRKNEKKMEAAGKIAEVVSFLSSPEERDDKIWELLLLAFQNIDRQESMLLKNRKCDLEAIYLFFVWNFFSSLGYFPELYNCPLCGKKLLPEAFWFIPKEGGVVCWRCFDELKKAWEEEKKKEKISPSKPGKEISVDAVKVLRLFLKEDWNTAKRIKLSEKIKKELNEISEFYFSFLKEFSGLEK